MTPTGWIVLGISALPVLPGTLLLVLLHKLRRAGHPDRAGEISVGLWMLAALLHLGAPLVWPHGPRWLWFTTAVPAALITAGILTARIRRHPDVLFSPATIARVRRWSAKVHRR